MTAQKFLRISALSIMAVFVTATAGSAQDAAKDAKPAAPALQTVAVQASSGVVQVASLSMPVQPATGGLHADPRWPAMVNCINNTATPVEFETCLRSAFMVDGTGMAATLARN